MSSHSERGRTFWVVLVALAALVAGLAAAISQRRASNPQPGSASPAIEPAAPPDTGEAIVRRALGQIPVDSTEIKNRWLDEVPGVDVSMLTPAQRGLFVRVANSYRCTCGCGFTLATCRAYDAQCPVSGAGSVMSARNQEYDASNPAGSRPNACHTLDTAPREDSERIRP